MEELIKMITEDSFDINKAAFGILLDSAKEIEKIDKTNIKFNDIIEIKCFLMSLLAIDINSFSKQGATKCLNAVRIAKSKILDICCEYEHQLNKKCSQKNYEDLSKEELIKLLRDKE